MSKQDKTLLIVLSEADSDALRDILRADELAGTRRGTHPLTWLAHSTLQAIKTASRLFFWKHRQA
jgi:hypothetical protein